MALFIGNGFFLSQSMMNRLRSTTRPHRVRIVQRDRHSEQTRCSRESSWIWRPRECARAISLQVRANPAACSCANHHAGADSAKGRLEATILSNHSSGLTQEICGRCAGPADWRALFDRPGPSDALWSNWMCRLLARAPAGLAQCGTGRAGDLESCFVPTGLSCLLIWEATVRERQSTSLLVWPNDERSTVIPRQDWGCRLGMHTCVWKHVRTDGSLLPLVSATSAFALADSCRSVGTKRDRLHASAATRS